MQWKRKKEIIEAIKFNIKINIIESGQIWEIQTYYIDI